MIRRLSLLAVTLLLGLSSATAEVTPESLVGKPLPKLGSLDYLKAKPDLAGKPAVIEFWATWCPPCRESIPHLNELYKTYGPKGLQVVGITDEPNQVIRAFVKTLPIDYPVASSRQDASANFGVSGIPHAFLVNKEGIIVWQGHPMSLPTAEIEKLL